MPWRVFQLLLLVLAVSFAKPLWSAQNLVLVQGDIVVADRPTARSIAIADDIQLWPAGIIPYTIDSTLPDASRAAVMQAIEHWNNVGGISLLPLSRVQQASASVVRDSIQFIPGEYCASWVGRRGGQQEVWVSATCPAGSVMHEIGHVLGLEHEHTRADRDQYITIHWDNITPDKQHNFDTAPAGSRLPGRYDYGSIMHYGTHNFSSNGQATISTVDGVNRRVGQRIAPSQGDIDAIAQLYGSDLSVTSQVHGDAGQAILEIHVSNQSSQGAHDIAIQIDVAAHISAYELVQEGWICASHARQTNVQCSMTQLAGSAVSRLAFDLSDVQSAPLINIVLSSKTPDIDLSNNVSRAQSGVDGSTTANLNVPQLAAALPFKAPIQDDTGAAVGLGGGASSYLTLGALLLLLVGQAGSRINRQVAGNISLDIFGVHRGYLSGR